jgi:multicomponent Na+:H+ antiporter subunit C
MIEQTILFVTSIILILLAMASMFYSRNLIKTLMSFQILVFGINLALFTNSVGGRVDLLANTLVLFSVLVGASVETVGLALIIQIYRKYGTLDPHKLRRLRQ